MKSEKGTMTRICPKCGKEYTAPPALSRVDNITICPDCGIREALESIGVCGEEQDRIVDIIHTHTSN